MAIVVCGPPPYPTVRRAGPELRSPGVKGADPRPSSATVARSAAGASGSNAAVAIETVTSSLVGLLRIRSVILTVSSGGPGGVSCCWNQISAGGRHDKPSRGPEIRSSKTSGNIDRKNRVITLYVEAETYAYANMNRSCNCIYPWDSLLDPSYTYHSLKRIY